MPAPGTPAPPPGPQITDRHPLALALFGLTLASGLIDAVSYLGLGHVFTANMTGNVVVIAFALAGAPGFSVAGSVTSLGAFLAGAAVAGRYTTGGAAGCAPRSPWRPSCTPRPPPWCSPGAPTGPPGTR
ncbi:hypothetical protein KCH_59830 [Kitasatospora cheerisanensis KCTC 2395]|uniref:DUF1275 family protein n=1 Tax=Kitasatospora cheerisanensis KCTC 2395 TaxID=1348663 RepID=A0A066YQM0_9ACTN|nr:hypothetical protein KCH_59830 [Kitasatospora cheerisanensis KCTC 2395]